MKLALKINLALCVISFLSNCRIDKHSAAKPGTASNYNKIDTVDVLIAKMESVQKELTLPAELLPFEQTLIYAKVPSYIRQIKVDIGSRVSKGQLLVSLDAPELSARVAEVSANTQTALVRMQNSYDLYQRLQGGQNTGAVSVREIEQSHNQLRVDSAAYFATKEILAAAKHQQEYLVIYAPFSGVVTKRNADAGTLVGTNNSMPLMELESNTSLRLRVAVPEVLVGSDLINNELNFKVKAYPNKTFKAKLSRKSDKIDPQTRSEIWEFTVENMAHDLKAGMFADAKLKFARPQSVITVPSSAVVTTLEKRFIIKVVADKTEWVDVMQGTGVHDKVEVFGNVAEGDVIVKTGNEELKANTTVVTRLPQK